MADQSPEASVRDDLLRSTASGAPALGHLVGLHREPDDGRYVLAFDPERPALRGGAGILEAAMLADLALGGVIRDHVGLAVRMPTVSMTLQPAAGRLGGVVRADAELSVVAGRSASSRCRLRTADGEVVVDAAAVFALPRLPYEGPGRAMPWDVVDGKAVATGHGTVDDSLVLDVVAHAAGSPAVAWGTEHVRRRLASAGSPAVLDPSPVMANRLGNVQGGALLAAAVMTAAEAEGFAPDALASATVVFVEPAALEESVDLHVSVVARRGRSLFADVRAEQAGTTRCQVSVVFRR